MKKLLPDENVKNFVYGRPKITLWLKFVESSNMAKVNTSRTTFSRFHNFQIKELSIDELDVVAKLTSFH